jgi:DNA-binding transcriptional regulator YiaG
MAITIPADLSCRSGSTPGSRLSLRHSRSWARRTSQRRWRSLSTVSDGQIERSGRVARSVSQSTSPSGVIGGAMVQAARRSARLTRLGLARSLTVGTATVRAWENGATPSFCLPYTQIQQLSEVLSRSGARAGHELGELLLASRCDLLLTGMLHGFEDYAEVPPIDEDGTEAEAARDLLHWALAGPVPERYRQHATPGPLLDKANIGLVIAAAEDLETGSYGRDLVEYGSALVALANL